MEKELKKGSLCFKVPSAESRKKVQGSINLKKLRGAYGSKSCRCACSCTDGY